MRFGFSSLAAILFLKVDHASAFSPLSRGAGLTVSTTSSHHHDQTRVSTVPFVKSLTRSSKGPLFMGGMEDFLTGRDDKARKAENDEYIAELQKRVDKINNLEPEIEDLEDDELVAKTAEFRERLKKGEDINGPLLEEAYAVVREAAWRVLELRHYDVQIMGGLALHDGRLAEMATGEGKTLVATLPCYVNTLAGKTSFVITVNDYLARRDMEKMGQVHRFLGLTVGLIQSGMTEEQRRKAYACDIVYVTNSELGFDFLRDHLALTPEQTVLPNGGGEFDGFCLVDEADSVLIDEARTPLIISKQVPAPANKYQTANTLAGALKPDVHYTVDLKNKNCVLNEVGYRDCERALGIDSLFEIQADGEAWAPYVTNAVKAKELFKRDVEYTVLEDDAGEKCGVGIVDAFTGRVLDGRRWSDGLHQSIEAMEGIDVSEQSKVIAKVTYQSLFRQFTRLAGMTGTAMADATELELTYGLRVTPIPTALPIARRDYPDVAFKTRKAADDSLVKEIEAVGGGQPDGRPCLVGTTSVAQSELLVKKLAEKGIKAELLNASPKNAPRESEIVAQAGRAGVVTVATNMAGRGTDILLGGCPNTMSRIKTRSVLLKDGILSSEEASKLPPSPEEDYFPTEATEDSIFMLKEAAAAIRKEFGSDLTSLVLEEILTVAFDTTEAEDDADYIVKLRNGAESIKETYSEALEEEKEAVEKAGGLYVMGTNRHESSRIDNQLRGRSGRQGNPGTSRFFLSFEDDMFVIFGGEKLEKMLTMFRVSEDMPVEAPQISESLDKVQKAVEQKYRDIRGEIFKFDDVLNGQRTVIYSRRRNILSKSAAESLEIMKEYNKQTVQDIVNAQTEDGVVNVEKVLEKIGQFFPSVAPLLQQDDLDGRSPEEVSTFVGVAVEEVFAAKCDEVDKKAVAAGKAPGSLGRSANYITLVSMDNAWSDHLQSMENLKESVILRKYQGRDPVVEYQNEAFTLFKGLEDTMRFNTVFSLWQSLAAAGQPAAQVA
ncbi:Protein translocase subunit SecA [Seminavis robusta]|uniref:Protein translocase subunit SecA n=1 Tax=Seminavis robusta TaxID=568900 RepID=A0A9N8E3H3_9STRA|nr:Protein translocase subunit SecA [Seminavis robusta]|eukprot:Sro611_g175330.1 Protein translocase subunit SecA (1002) ;mRNA; f:24266-27453